MLDRPTAKVLGVGLALALVFFLVPPCAWTGETMVTLVHELGHAVVFWGFGYPAIPAFDFVYGGGVTFSVTRFALLWLAVDAGLAFAAFRLWKENWRTLAVATAVIACLHATLALVPAHQTLIAIAGHAAELAIGGIFLYRAASGAAILVPAERPMYAALGFYIPLHATGFAWKLLADKATKDRYLAGKAGIANDLVQVGDALGIGLDGAAALFLAASFIPLVIVGAWVTLSRRQGAATPTISTRSNRTLDS